MEIASLNLAANAVASTPSQQSSLVYVGWGTRAGARILDLILHMGTAFAVGILLAIVLSVANALGVSSAGPLLQQLQEGGGAAANLLALFGFILYTSVCEGLFGSTAGKYATGLVVLRDDGAPCTYTQAVGRSFAFLIDGILFGLVGYLAMKSSAWQQRNGDKWCDTVVVTRASAPPASLRKAVRFVGVVLLALFLDAMAIAAGVLL